MASKNQAFNYESNPQVAAMLQPKSIGTKADKEVFETQRTTYSRVFGTWFSTSGTPEELINRINDQIAKCKSWISNLEVLKTEAQSQLKAQKKNELAMLQDTLSEEDLEAMLKAKRAANGGKNK